MHISHDGVIRNPQATPETFAPFPRTTHFVALSHKVG